MTFRITNTRPLAYSVVADLIHHVRAELPIAQLGRVVHLFSYNMNDATFTISIQTMCAKLLNTIVESIYGCGDPQEASRIMTCMFHTTLEKLMAITDTYDRLKAISIRDKNKGKARDTTLDGDVDMDEAALRLKDRQEFGWREIELAMPIQQVAYASESLETFCRGKPCYVATD